MGTLDHHNFGQKDLDLRSCSGMLIVASEANTASLGAISESSAFPGMVVMPCDDSAPIPSNSAALASVVVVEVNPARRESLARLTDLKHRFPSLPIIAAIAEASVSLTRTLVREGVADVVTLPFNTDELLQTSLDVLANSRHNAVAEIKLAPMLAVVRSIGGCGATTIATHLAAELASHSPTGRGAVIADLDLQLGAVSHYLGVTPRGDLSNLLEAGSRLDEELLRSVAADAGNGLAVISAPEAILPLETVDTDQLLRIITLLRQQFDYVVLDLPANWTNWTLSAAAAADRVLMVVELSIASLRQAQRRLELFRTVGIAGEAVEIVVNRFEKRLFRTIDTSDVASTLGHTVLGSVALDAPTVNAAQDQGRLVGDVARRSKFQSDIAALATALRTGGLARID